MRRWPTRACSRPSRSRRSSRPSRPSSPRSASRSRSARERENQAYQRLLGAPANIEALEALAERRQPDFISIDEQFPTGRAGRVMELRYLYVGSSDVGRDVAAWLRVPGAKARWRFRHFGADVAAIDLGSPPVVLLADHRPPGSILPIYAVDDLDSSVAELDGAGWARDIGPMGTPEGPACVVRQDRGSAIALLQVERPNAMDAAYAEAGNVHAVRPATAS